MIGDQKVLFSGMQATGNLTLGNYLGALKNWVNISDEYKEHLSERELITKLITKVNEGNMKSLYCLSEHYYCDLTKKNCGRLIARISSEKMLAELAVNAGFNNNSWMTYAAIKCISTPSVIEDIALRFSKEYSSDSYNPAYDFTKEIRIHLVDSINNPSVLIKIHQTDKNETIRHRVVVKLLGLLKTSTKEKPEIMENIDIIREIVMNCPDTEIQEEARKIRE